MISIILASIISRLKDKSVILIKRNERGSVYADSYSCVGDAMWEEFDREDQVVCMIELPKKLREIKRMVKCNG